jgi:capsular polysaccharide export protein
MNGNSRFPKDPEAILKLASSVPKADLARRYEDSFWAMAAGDMLYHLGNLFFWWLFPNYHRPYKRDHPVLHYLSIGRRLLFAKANNRRAAQRLSELKEANAHYFVFPLQLENDFQIVAYSPFDSLEEAIQLVIKSFAENTDANTTLLVKAHPLEPGIRNWKKLVSKCANKFGVVGRIVYIDGGNLDEIISGSDGMVTVNSTAGIRALQLGSPVITLGEAIYNVAGLTYQGELDDYWKEAKQPDPALVEAFINAVAGTIQIRGVFYKEPGLNLGVSEAVDRLYNRSVGLPWKTDNNLILSKD